MNNIADKVSSILKDSLYKSDELTDEMRCPADAVKVQGIVQSFGFHPGRLLSHKQEIATLCNEMPEQFQKSKGGGWSFLNLCQKKDGVQWGEQTNCEELLVLAIATGQGGYCMSRDMWPMLPGGVPYVYFDTRGFAENVSG